MSPKQASQKGMLPVKANINTIPAYGVYPLCNTSYKSARHMCHLATTTVLSDIIDPMSTITYIYQSLNSSCFLIPHSKCKSLGRGLGIAPLPESVFVGICPTFLALSSLYSISVIYTCQWQSMCALFLFAWFLCREFQLFQSVFSGW